VLRFSVGSLLAVQQTVSWTAQQVNKHSCHTWLINSHVDTIIFLYVICTEMNTKHINTVWAECTGLECYTCWCISYLVGCKRLKSLTEYVLPSGNTTKRFLRECVVVSFRRPSEYWEVMRNVRAEKLKGNTSRLLSIIFWGHKTLLPSIILSILQNSQISEVY